jgi:hypothetical protein
MKRLLNVAWVLSSLAFSAHSQGLAPEKEFQVWSDTQISIPLIKSDDGKSDKVSMQVFGTLRFGRSRLRAVDERIGIAFEYKAGKHVTLTPAYLYAAAQPVAGVKAYEHRIRLDAGFEKRFKRFTLRDRNRIEYRFRNSRADIVRYRNRAQLAVPVRRNNKELFTPYVSDEVFYDITNRRWTRNEVSVGVGKKFTDRFSADVYYLLQNNRGAFFKHLNVIGTTFRFRIDR